MTASTPSASILVVDDEPDLRTLYELTLLREGYKVETASNIREAREQLKGQRFDVLITDMRLPDGFGMELLQDLRDQQRKERCLVMTAYGSAENAVEALRAGAFDYLTKPVDLKQFRLVVASAVQGTGSVSPQKNGQSTPPSRRTSSPIGGCADTLAAGNALDKMVGQSDAMCHLKQRLAKVAKSMAPVLVHGESGTGKELAAQALHAASQRADGPLIAVNCGAIPENLLEAEFFGARKGSYTGATQDRDGYFQAARGGTLFLDEIGDLPLAMQSKLLRAIQERSVRALGATQEESVDVRIISATHRDLAADVRAGRFRQDLYYRLNVIEIVIPPLRERREDLPALCEALLARIAQETGEPTPQLTPKALEAIASYPLTGNVRELENLLHRAVALTEGKELQVDWDHQTAEGSNRSTADNAHAEGGSASTTNLNTASRRATDNLRASSLDAAPIPKDLQAWLDQQERDILVRALRECSYNRTAAAARLGISLRQMRYRIARLRITMPHEYPDSQDLSDDESE